MDKKYVCPCGLTCGDCLFYKKEIFEKAQELREIIRKYNYDKFLILLSQRNSWQALGKHFNLSEEAAWDQFGQYFEAFQRLPDFLNTLDGIIAIQCKATCNEAGGCSFGGTTKECAALKCIKDKGFEGCWQCGEFEACDQLRLLKHNYGYVIEENLKKAKDKGVEAVESHGDRYYAWQRRM